MLQADESLTEANMCLYTKDVQICMHYTTRTIVIVYHISLLMQSVYTTIFYCTGAERFSNYGGYADTFRYTGPHNDTIVR